MELLKLDNVTINYDNCIAVRDISFTVNSGDYFCIVGSNGSGKSTLIRGILGLVPVGRGSITYGIPRERVAYLPQVSTITADFPATVWEIVLTGTQRSGRRLPFNTKADAKRAKEAIERLEIGHITKRRLGELSGGQRQRVLLARALCRDPQLLILDEPFTGLDENISECLYGLLSDLNQAGDMALLMVSHDLDEVEYHSSKVAVIDQTLLFCGDIEGWREFRAGKGCHES